MFIDRACTTDGIFSTAANSDFSLPSSTRHSLSSILVIHPVAAFLTLVCFALAVAAHFHSPAHSPRYLLLLLILSFPTLLVSLLAFLVDLLLFVPHLNWGGWIVLAATILVVISGVVTCAMRRTLVSRKARKRRIAENAEMNGENYYANRAAAAAVATEDLSLAKAESPPPTSAGPLVDKTPSSFATYDVTKETRPSLSNDDRTPLNPRDPSIRSTPSERERRGMARGDEGGMPPPRMGPGPGPGAGMGGGVPRDQYGNPMAMGPGMRQDSQSTIGTGRGGMPQYYGRGRGGYPPPGPMRGGYGPPRGGYPGPARGGYPPGPMRGAPQGMRGPPPPQGPFGPGNGRGQMGGMGPMAAGAMGGMAAGAMMGRGGRGGPPPPGYDNRMYAGGRGQSPERGFERDPSPPLAMPSEPGMVGQAIEMDARTGSPARSPVKPGFGFRDSDSDLNGMVALQGGQREALQGPPRLHDSVSSPTSEYSDPHTSFVPARANWNRPPPQDISNMNNGLSPIEDSPVELPTQQFHESPRSTPSPAVAGTTPRKVRSFSRPRSPTNTSPEPLPSRTPPPRTTTPRSAGGHTRSGSESYYEDVDPRFANADPAPPNVGLPTALQAGFNRSSPVSNDRSLLPSQSGPALTGRLPTPPSRPGTAPSGQVRSRQGSRGNNEYLQASTTPPIGFNSITPANDRMVGLGAMGAIAGRGLGPMAQHADPSTSNTTTTGGSLGLASHGLRNTPTVTSVDSPYAAAASFKPSSDNLLPTTTPVLDSEDPSLETLPSGARSPAAESDISHFTSISQRGVNPRWRPPPGPMPAYDGADYGDPSPIAGPGGIGYNGGYGLGPGLGGGRARGGGQARQEDMLLAGAPDFSIPGVGPGGRGAGRGAGMRVAGGGVGAGAIGRGGMYGAASQGRYPSEM
ncbi:MAG: regulator of ime2 [Bathelium mastoideum]|nr:MAG: regulator of ime2 [Bathelium mastoideum]